MTKKEAVFLCLNHKLPPNTKRFINTFEKYSPIGQYLPLTISWHTYRRPATLWSRCNYPRYTGDTPDPQSH